MDDKSAQLIEKLKSIACHPLATEAERADAIKSAYEIGVAEGRVQGCVETGDRLLGVIGGRATA